MARILHGSVHGRPRSASFRGLRGVTCISVVCGEIAYWLGGNPLRMRLATICNSSMMGMGCDQSKLNVLPAKSIDILPN